MKKRTRLVLMTLICMCAIVALALPVAAAKNKSIKVKPKKLILDVGEKYKIKVNTKGKKVWSSQDDSVATVNSQGIVQAIGEGQTKISVKVGKKSNSVTVIVDTSNERYELLQYIGRPLSYFKNKFPELTLKQTEKGNKFKYYKTNEDKNIEVHTNLKDRVIEIEVKKKGRKYNVYGCGLGTSKATFISTLVKQGFTDLENYPSFDLLLNENTKRAVYPDYNKNGKTIQFIVYTPTG